MAGRPSGNQRQATQRGTVRRMVQIGPLRIEALHDGAFSLDGGFLVDREVIL